MFSPRRTLRNWLRSGAAGSGTSSMSTHRHWGLALRRTTKLQDDGLLRVELNTTPLALALALLGFGQSLVLLTILSGLDKTLIPNSFVTVFGIGTSMIFGLVLCQGPQRS